MLAKKTSKNQVTLPKEIADKFTDTTYFDIVIQDNLIILTPVQISPITHSIEQIRAKMETLGIDENDVRDAVSWARRRKK
ncbi:MAG: hypothetical protein H6Q52_2775 [Deltaproteobacteria bacterium]|nr:hypothetical protein [Deltaproteobacteria bacterium]